MMSKISFFCRLALFLAVLGSQVGVGLGAPIEDALKSLKDLSAKERLARVESEARKEGSVRWASSTPQAWAEPALQLFRKRYPMIQVEYMRQSGRVLAERIVREHRAGKYDIDIVGTSAVTFAGMKDAGVIAPYLSPEAG
jgi:DNA-binding transcriptional LysR family regulator